MAREVEGPDQYWSDDVPASRGQWRAIAAAACELLDVPVPASRLDATTLLVRLRRAIGEKPETPRVPPPW